MASQETIGKDFVVGNGVQTGFGTGATRSTDVDKIDFEGHISPVVLRLYGEYMHEHRVQRDGKVRASDNWQQGIPIYRYVKSLIRHTQEFWLMWRGEVAINPDNGKPFTFKAVLCAILFNTMGILFEMARHKHNPLAMAYMTETARLELEGADKVKTETAPTPFAAFVDEVARKEDAAMMASARLGSVGSSGLGVPPFKTAESPAYCADEGSLLTGACCGQPATCKYPCSVGKRAGQPGYDHLVYEGTLENLPPTIPLVPGKRYRITREL